MRYVLARFKKESIDKAYRIFVTDALDYIPQNKYHTTRFADIVYFKNEDTRTGDEIALDVIKKAGLKVIS